MVRRFSLPLLAVLGLAAGAAVPAVGEDAGIYAFIHSQRPERTVAPARPMPEAAAVMTASLLASRMNPSLLSVGR